MATYESVAKIALVLLLVCPRVVAQVATMDSRWSFQTQNDKSVTSCHPLKYFVEHWEEFNYAGKNYGPYPTNVKDKGEAHSIGVANGFAIYDVFHRITDAKPSDTIVTESLYLPTVMKMIVIERKPGEFCELFNEENFAGQQLLSVGPSYLVAVDSQTILVTNDQINGSCGCFNEAYWTFDKDGPIALDFQYAIREARAKFEPSGLSYREEFDIQTLTYRKIYQPYSYAERKTSGGELDLRFSLKDHQLALVSGEFKPEVTNP